MKRTSKCMLLMVAGIIAGVGGSVMADSPAPFYLASQPVVPIPAVSFQQLAREFPAFKHRPFATAGFNAMVMPFHYLDQTAKGNGDAAEANAFSFLVSNDLDWSPACYCMRHAYFVFKTDPEITAALVKKYDVKEIQNLLRRWSGTQAVGGKIIKTDQGYQGELDIFNPKGEQTSKIRFEKPESYFDLLGDVSVAAITAMGPPPNAALVKHLHLVRAKNPHSIVLLGRAAFAKYRSAEETGLYDQVLEEDPGFADVRAYATTQRRWMGMDVDEECTQQGMSLDSYLTSECIRTFWVPHCPAQFVAKLLGWQSEAKKLWGANSPKAIAYEIYNMDGRERISPELTAAAMKAAADYPNDYYSLLQCARAVGDLEISSAPDMDMAAGMYIAALGDRVQTGRGTKPEAAAALSNYFRWMGRNDLAVRVLNAPGADEDERNIFLLMITLEDVGHFDEELNVYDRFHTILKNADGICSMHAGMAAAMLGRVAVLDRVIKDKHDILNRNQLLPLLLAYRDVLMDKDLNADQIAAASQSKDWSLRWFYQMLLAEIDLTRHSDLFYGDIKTAVMSIPTLRPGWLLAVGYDQQKHRPELADFYRGLRWLYPDDPWAVSAVAKWTAQHPEEANGHPDLAPVEKALADYPAQRWTAGGPQATAAQLHGFPDAVSPWAVAAAVADLTGQHEFQQAKDLAMRFENFTAQLHSDQMSAWPNHLYYRVIQCEAEGR